jgi:hypothetical protein
MIRTSFRTSTFACALLLIAGSCALPELTIDPSVDDEDDENGGGGRSGGTGGTSGSGASGGASGGDQGGTGGVTGGTDGKGGATGGNGGATGGTDGKGGAIGTTGGTGGVVGVCNPPCEADQTCTNGTCTGPCGTSFAVASNGWVTAPGVNGTCWRGYSYVAQDGANVTKADLATCGTNCTLCMSGTVYASEDYSAYAILGVNVAQASSGSPAGAVAPTGTYLEVSFTNDAGSQLRVVIAGPNSATDPTGDSWCVDVVGTGATQRIPYSSFRTNCWDTSGSTYRNQPITSIQLIVPSQNTTDVAVDACLLGFADR